MVRTTNPTDRTEVDHARVSVFVEDAPHGYPMAVPTDDDVGVRDLGDLVADRIEANGKVTLPDDVEPGTREELGVVYWDERGIPTRLVRDDDVVVFTDNGGVDEVVEDGGEDATKTITFGVYPDPDTPFAVLNEENPDIPRGTLANVQDAVAVHFDDVDHAHEEAGTVTYEPGKDDGRVVDISFAGSDE